WKPTAAAAVTTPIRHAITSRNASSPMPNRERVRSTTRRSRAPAAERRTNMGADDIARRARCLEWWRTMPASREKVVVAMSGGVDSSVAAALLLREGYDVVGAFLRLGSPSGVEATESCDPGAKSKQGCCSVLDAVDARRVAGILGVPFYVL